MTKEELKEKRERFRLYGEICLLMEENHEDIFDLVTVSRCDMSLEHEIVVRMENGDSGDFRGIQFEDGMLWVMYGTEQIAFLCVSSESLKEIYYALKNYFNEGEKQGEQKPDTNCLLSWSEMDEKMLQSLEGIVKDYWAKAEQEKNEIKIKEASNVSYFLKTIQKSPLCWIKCSDGLPNKDGIYLVVTDGRHNDVYDMARYDSIEGWHKASEIIYWMPIPQLNNKNIIEQKPTDNIKKPAWSEEDEEYINDLIGVFDGQQYQAHSDEEIVKWLKSIRLPYNKEWDENDEEMLRSIIATCELAEQDRDSSPARHLLEMQLDWLKSLRPKVTWKPSDEQMGVIEAVINNRSFQRRHLDSLYEQLKKLRG